VDAPDGTPAPGGDEAPPNTHVLLVPLKRFDQAKERLTGSLGRTGRRDLAERLADGVLAAGAGLHVVVVCADDATAGWVIERGASVHRCRGDGLVDDVSDAYRAVSARGADRVTIAPGDLARPRRLGAFLAEQLGARTDRNTDLHTDRLVIVVPDRRRDGTNLLSLPAGLAFRFRYGPGSAAAHDQEARRLDLEVRTVADEDLGWDVDLPDDLSGLDRAGEPGGTL